MLALRWGVDVSGLEVGMGLEGAVSQFGGGGFQWYGVRNRDLGPGPSTVQCDENVPCFI